MSSKRKKKWLIWAAAIAAVILAILYMRCAGIGFGGTGDESEDEAEETTPQPLTAAPTPDAALPRCQVRVDASGASLAGDKVEIADITGRCAGGVELTVTGDARYGDAEAVRDAVKAAGIDLLDRSL